MENSNQSTARRWINAAVVITSGLVGYTFWKFFLQLGEWFDLEARMPNFELISQAVAFLVGIGLIVYMLRSKKVSGFLNEVYAEMEKVVFPNRPETSRSTIVVIIGVSIVGCFLFVFDFLSRKGLDELTTLLVN